MAHSLDYFTDEVRNKLFIPLTSSQYNSKIDTVIKEDESAKVDASSKYINPATYKQRLNNIKR